MRSTLCLWIALLFTMSSGAIPAISDRAFRIPSLTAHLAIRLRILAFYKSLSGARMVALTYSLVDASNTLECSTCYLVHHRLSDIMEAMASPGLVILRCSKRSYKDGMRVSVIEHTKWSNVFQCHPRQDRSAIFDFPMHRPRSPGVRLYLISSTTAPLVTGVYGAVELMITYLILASPKRRNTPRFLFRPLPCPRRLRFLAFLRCHQYDAPGSPVKDTASAPLQMSVPLPSTSPFGLVPRSNNPPHMQFPT